MKAFANTLIYALLYAVVRLHALLPMAALYVLSDVFYVLIYKLVGYRLRVVRSNLEGAFPHLSPDERLRLERHQQRMLHALRLRLERETARLAHACQRLPAASAPALQSARQRLQSLAQAWPLAAARALQAERERLTRAALRLDLLDPRHTLARGYALLQTSGGLPLPRAAQAQPGQPVRATLADGALALTVQSAEVSPAQRGG